MGHRHQPHVVPIRRVIERRSLVQNRLSPNIVHRSPSSDGHFRLRTRILIAVLIRIANTCFLRTTQMNYYFSKIFSLSLLPLQTSSSSSLLLLPRIPFSVAHCSSSMVHADSHSHPSQNRQYLKRAFPAVNNTNQLLLFKNIFSRPLTSTDDFVVVVSSSSPDSLILFAVLNISDLRDTFFSAKFRLLKKFSICQ